MPSTQPDMDIHSPAFTDHIASLMAEAVDSPEGMKALAAAIAAPIEQEIRRKEISSLLLHRHVLPIGERPVYQIKPTVQAYWVSKEGEARRQELGHDEIEFPTNRILAYPEVDVSVLRHGNIGKLSDIQTSAANAIRKEIDKRTIQACSAAVPEANTVEVTGGRVTEAAMNEAISILEDQELTVKHMVLRGRRFNDMRGWDLDQETRSELRMRGIIKNYGTASIILSSAAPLDEILLFPDEEVGKMPVREALKTRSVEKPTEFKVGWMAWSEIGQGVTRPDLMAKIRILP